MIYGALIPFSTSVYSLLSASSLVDFVVLSSYAGSSGLYQRLFLMSPLFSLRRIAGWEKSDRHMNLPCLDRQVSQRFHFTSLHFTCYLVHSELPLGKVTSISEIMLAYLNSITQQCEMLAFIQSDSGTRSSAFQPPSG